MQKPRKQPYQKIRIHFQAIYVHLYLLLSTIQRDILSKRAERLPGLRRNESRVRNKRRTICQDLKVPKYVNSRSFYIFQIRRRIEKYSR